MFDGCGGLLVGSGWMVLKPLMVLCGMDRTEGRILLIDGWIGR